MSDYQSLYNQLLQDSEFILDGMPLDIMNAAMMGEESNLNPFLLAYDTDAVNEAIILYSEGKNIPPLSLKERWCLAVRMKSAADILHPFVNQHSEAVSSVKILFEKVDKCELLRILLIDAAPILSSVLSGQVTFGEEWSAPIRLPWHQTLLRKL